MFDKTNFSVSGVPGKLFKKKKKKGYVRETERITVNAHVCISQAGDHQQISWHVAESPDRL